MDLVSELRAARLSGYAYVALEPSHPARARLRPDYLTALSGHAAIKRELLPLIAAWNLAGIEPLLFKGFHLSEFVYPAPGMRFHGDVDLLVPAEAAPYAGHIARTLGWVVEQDTSANGEPHSHCAYCLRGPRGAACVDLHRLVLHSHHRWNRVQQRVTEAVWRASRVRDWDGVRVREMSGVDALLVGLVLQRCWGGDEWHLKAHDSLDALLLVERCGISAPALRARARELGAARTLELFLARCNPFEHHFDSRPPTTLDRWRWKRAAFRERGLMGTMEQRFALLLEPHHLLVDCVRGLASVLAARRALRRHADLHVLLQSLTVNAAARAKRPPVKRLMRGPRWLARLFPRNPRGDCLLRSLAAYWVLRRHGWPVRFVSGVRRGTGGVIGHAWLELDGRVLPELNEPNNRAAYTIGFEYP